MILEALGKFQTKRILKLHVEFNFQNFQKKKKKIIIDCYNILTIGIAIIEFHINIIKDLGFYYHSKPLSTSYYFGK